MFKKCLVILMVVLGIITPTVYASAQDVSSVDNEPGRFQLEAKSNTSQYLPGKLIVKYKNDNRKLASGIDTQSVAGTKVLKRFASGAQLLTVDGQESLEQVKKQLEASEQVEYVEYDYQVKPYGLLPNDPYFKKQWGLLNFGQKINDVRGYPGIDINAFAAWQITRGNPSVTVAVIDTGMDTDHPELLGQCWLNDKEIPANGIDDDNNGYIDDVNGYDFFYNDASVYDPSDYDLHATYVAGIIGAKGNNSLGVHGIAPGVKIMPLKFIGGPTVEGSISDAIEAIEYAHLMGARVCNLSWGGPEYSQALRDTIANYSDMLFIASAGNEATNIDSQPVYPAAFDCPNLITVAAIDNQGKKPEWSNFGINSVDVAAPGMDIIGIIDWPEPQPDEYLYVAGTSAAAPHVSAIAALLFSKYPDMSIDNVKESILLSVKRVPELKAYTKTGGTVDAFSALLLGGFMELKK